MAKNAKPRKKQTRKAARCQGGGAAKVMAKLYPHRNRIAKQNDVLALITWVNEDKTTVKDLDQLYHYALLHSELVNRGFADCDRKLYKDWDDAMDAAYRRSDAGLRAGFNPSEKPSVIALLMDLLRMFELVQHEAIYEVDRQMADKHNAKVLKIKAQV